MDEYIERRKAVDAIAELMATGFIEDRFIMPQELQDLQDELEQLPTADVAPVVHGRWIVCTPPEELKHMTPSFYCSVCERNAAFNVDGIEPIPPQLFNRLIYKYCPHCGAKMNLDAE